MSLSLACRRVPMIPAVLVVIGFAVLCALVSLATPGWEANDEPDHVQNIEALAGGAWYRIEPGAGLQPHQPQLYYLVMAAYQRVVGIASFPVQTTPANGTDAGLFTHDDAQVERRIHVLRLPNIGMGVITVAVTALLAALLSSSAGVIVASMATVAFQPRFLFLSAVLNNDNLAITLGALSTLLVVALFRADPSSRGARIALPIALGACLGLLVSTKFSGVPFAAVAIAIVAVVDGRRAMWRRSALVAAVAAVVALPALWSNVIRYGHPLAQQATIDHLRTIYPYLVDFDVTRRWLVVDVSAGFLTSLWYTSGWNQLRWSARAYVPFWFLMLGGWVVAFLPAFSPVREAARGTKTVCAALLLLFGAAAAFVWIQALSASQFQGRYALIAFPGAAVVAALGYDRLRRVRIAMWLLPTACLVGSVWAIRSDVLHAYL